MSVNVCLSLSNKIFCKHAALQTRYSYHACKSPCKKSTYAPPTGQKFSPFTKIKTLTCTVVERKPSFLLSLTNTRLQGVYSLLCLLLWSRHHSTLLLSVILDTRVHLFFFFSEGGVIGLRGAIDPAKQHGPNPDLSLSLFPSPFGDYPGQSC